MSVPDAEGLVWIDGRLVGAADATVPVVLRGVQSGIGVFETLAVRRNLPVDLEEHLARLVRSSARFEVPLPARVDLDEAVRHIAGSIPSGHGWAKILVVRGAPAAVFGGAADPADEGSPCRARILPWSRHRRDPLVGVKSTSYAASVLGLEWARTRGCDEGLWRNDRGHLTEGCTSNLFVVKRGALYTASERDGILAGVTRAKVLEAARSLRMTVHEGKLRAPRLFRADEAFLTSSTRGVRPLLEVDGRSIGSGAAGPVTRTLGEATAALRGIFRELTSKGR